MVLLVLMMFFVLVVVVNVLLGFSIFSPRVLSRTLSYIWGRLNLSMFLLLFMEKLGLIHLNQQFNFSKIDNIQYNYQVLWEN